MIGAGYTPAMSGLLSFTVGKPTRRCCVTGRALESGEVYIATLEDLGDGQPLQRVDYSLDAWKATGGRRPTLESGERRPGMRVGFWRAVVHEGNAKAKPILDDAALTDLFEQTGEVVELPQDDASALGASSAAEKRAALRFVVALLMVRRKLLTLEGVTRRGAMLLRRKGEPKPPEGPPLTEVHDPGLDEATIVDVLAELEGEGGSGTTSTEAAASPTVEVKVVAGSSVSAGSGRGA